MIFAHIAQTLNGIRLNFALILFVNVHVRTCRLQILFCRDWRKKTTEIEQHLKWHSNTGKVKCAVMIHPTPVKKYCLKF